MPEEATWESASAVPEPTLDAPATEPPVTPPAETQTLEKPEAPQLEAETVPVRESVSEPEPPEPPKIEAKPAEEYVSEPDDPAELAALPTPAAKKWAKRQYQDARPVHTFLDYTKPIKEFGDELYKRSSTRYAEHVDDLITADRNYTSMKLFGASFDDIQARLQTNQPATTPKTTSTSTEVVPLTADQLAEMSVEQVAQHQQQLLTAQQTKWEQERQKIESDHKSQLDNIQKQLDAVNGKLGSKEQQDRQIEIETKQGELYNNVWSVVNDGIRDSGLEVQPTDPPKIASLKRAAARLLDESSIQRAFDAVPENLKLVEWVVEATRRGEFHNAFREEDNLKVRARAAFESVKNSPEVKAIFDEIEAYANQSKATTRAANPIPPAPGSSVGVNIKPPESWDALEQSYKGAAA